MVGCVQMPTLNKIPTNPTKVSLLNFVTKVC